MFEDKHKYISTLHSCNIQTTEVPHSKLKQAIIDSFANIKITTKIHFYKVSNWPNGLFPKITII